MAHRELSSDHPVLSVVHERIHHYEAMMRNRISRTDKSIANRKTLQKQKKPPLSKPIVEAVIEELEELRKKLISALSEELNQTMATAVLRTLVRRIKKYQKKREHINRVQESLASGETRKEEQEEVLSSEPTVTALLKELRNLTWPLISALKEELRQICRSSVFQFETGTKNCGPIEELMLLVNLASLLDVKSQKELSPAMMPMHRFDKGCLMYDYMTEKEVHLLSENDRKFISLLRFLVTSQPANEIHPVGTTASADCGTFPSDSTKVEIVRSIDKKIYLGAYLKEDRGSKGEGKMEVHAKTPSPKMKSPFGPSCCPMNSCRSEKSALVMDEARATSYWDSLQQTERQKLLVVPASILDKHCALLGSSCVRDLLSETVLFYKLHGTWEIYICPKPGCFRWFKEDKSLIGHLKSDHFPIFHGIDIWPSTEDIPTEQRCIDALCRMVWKPIHLQGAINLLSRMYLDHTCVNKSDICGGCDQFCSLKWPLSKDPMRSKLLEKLGMSFQVLIAKEKMASYSLLSRGYLMKMTVLAFENILTHLAPSDRVLFLGCTLAHSPLSFCFLGKEALSFFIILVDNMCQLVTQAAECSRNEKLDPNKCDVNWNNSEILHLVSFSVDEDCFVLDPAMTKSLCCGEWSIPSWLCNAPCCTSIRQVPAEASEVFEKVEDKVVSLMHCVLAVKSRFSALISEKRWASFRYPWLQSGFKFEMKPLELDQLQLQCELESLEPQFRHLCALDLRMYILPLMRSFLQMKLCNFLRDHELEVAKLEEHPVEIFTKGSSEEGFAQEKIDSNEYCEGTRPEEYSDDGGSEGTRSEEYFDDGDGEGIGPEEYPDDGDSEGIGPEEYSDDGDSEGIGPEEYSDDRDSEGTEPEEYSDDGNSEVATFEEYSDCEFQTSIEESSWMAPSFLDNIDSTLRENFGPANKDPPTFFLIPVSDIVEHSEQACLGSRYGVRWEGITWFRLNKSWKYMCCYSCNKSFLDLKSHMVHMEHEHQLGLSNDKSWLVPFDGKMVNLSQVSVDGEAVVEDCITLDSTCCYVLVDATKFYQLKVNESEVLGPIKHKQFMDVFKGLQDQLGDLRGLLNTKSKHLRCLEVVHCLHEMLFNGNHSLALLVTWLHKLSLSKSHVGSCHLFQLLFLCRVLEQAQTPLSNNTVKHSFANMRHRLITTLYEQDRKIKELIVQKNNSWRHLSDLCVCDYRSKIAASVRSFIHETFGVYGNLFSGTCDKIKNALSSIGSFHSVLEVHDFSVEVFPGKVLIRKMKRKPTWSYAYMGFVLKFDGEWFMEDHRERISGTFTFSASSNWHQPGLEWKGDLSLHIEHETSERIGSFKWFLEEYLFHTVGDRLLLLQKEFEQKIEGR